MYAYTNILVQNPSITTPANQMHRRVRVKIQNFFNYFSNNKLVPSILSKTPQYSHHLRKFTLIIEGRVLFEPPCKNQIVN